MNTSTTRWQHHRHVKLTFGMLYEYRNYEWKRPWSSACILWQPASHTHTHTHVYTDTLRISVSRKLITITEKCKYNRCLLQEGKRRCIVYLVTCIQNRSLREYNLKLLEGYEERNSRKNPSSGVVGEPLHYGAITKIRAQHELQCTVLTINYTHQFWQLISTKQPVILVSKYLLKLNLTRSASKDSRRVERLY